MAGYYDNRSGRVNVDQESEDKVMDVAFKMLRIKSLTIKGRAGK
jgi:hypothetical protein